MSYLVEFVRWNEGDAVAQVVGAVGEVFETEQQAYVHANGLMAEMRAHGATAFRIFDENEKPEELGRGPLRLG